MDGWTVIEVAAGVLLAAGIIAGVRRLLELRQAAG